MANRFQKHLLGGGEQSSAFFFSWHAAVVPERDLYWVRTPVQWDFEVDFFIRD